MNCNLCPRKCNADRKTNVGYCGMKDTVCIALYKLFFYEEPCITAIGGSGAIFFSGCSLRCVYCQNYEISSLKNGKEISVQRLAEIFKELEKSGAENINLVNPTHYVSQIEEALKIYKPSIPIVYNSHGYESEETIKKVAKFCDIFLPDFKYFDNDIALRYSGAKDYVEVCKKTLKLMRQLKQDKFNGDKMISGVLIRHLILPLQTDDSIKILDWIKHNLPSTKVSLMSQYTPYGRANEFKEINRKITKREYDKVVNSYLNLGLDGYIQDRESANCVYIPKWDY